MLNKKNKVSKDRTPGEKQVLPRFELGSLDSKSKVLPLHHRTYLPEVKPCFIVGYHCTKFSVSGTLELRLQRRMRCNGYLVLNKKHKVSKDCTPGAKQVLPRFELESLDSMSKVLTSTP